ncbi:MAG: hypothetical protein IPL84_17200 [Chitinophagaceae bacterium]|nr:hypothetical protein [Chitinophagaceae bacterium]
MKKLIKPFKIILPLLLLAQTSLFAQNENDNGSKKKYEFVKTKSVNKSYNVSSSDKLNIQNSFGKVEIHTWNKNEIKVDVSIEVSANTNDLAQKVLDKISVAESQSGKEISFKTSINNINNSKNEKSSMSIDYSIYMPANNPLKVKNDFGATVVPDYRGEVDLTSKFGSLTAGDLSDVKNINVEFGKAKFNNITDGSITIKYSKAEFGKLSGKIDLKFEFCSGIVMSLDNSLAGMDVKSSYSTVNMKPSSGLSASYDISTSFGSLKNRTAIKFEGDDEQDRRGPKFDFRYNGKSGNGAVQIKVKTSFGDIILGEPEPGDMKDKSKNKSRTS